mgnify:CR=1 FL=1
MRSACRDSRSEGRKGYHWTFTAVADAGGKSYAVCACASQNLASDSNWLLSASCWSGEFYQSNPNIRHVASGCACRYMKDL